MSHDEQQQFFRELRIALPAFFDGVRVLEIGSLDINGTVRDHFTQCDYIGVDLGEGPGVDVVAHGEDLDYSDGAFATIISAECFEHNAEWRKTFANAVRMCNGLVAFTAATEGRAEHGTPRTTPEDSPFTSLLSSYYENVMPEEILEFPLDEWFVTWELSVNDRSHDVYFWGIRDTTDSTANQRNAAIARGLMVSDPRALSRAALEHRLKAHLLDDLSPKGRVARVPFRLARKTLAILVNRKRIAYAKSLRNLDAWRRETRLIASGSRSARTTADGH